MNALLTKLKGEPVAFYGGLISALLAVLAFVGVDADMLALLGTVATLLGIPVTRSRVTPTVKTARAEDGAVDAGSLALGLVAGLVIAWIVLH